MMARPYANENFPLPAVEARVALGHDVLTSAAAGNAGRAVPDDEVFRFSIDQRRALVTLNRRHLLRLAGNRPNRAGVVLYTFDPDFRRQAQAIDTQIRRKTDLAGEIIRVYRPS